MIKIDRCVCHGITFEEIRKFWTSSLTPSQNVDNLVLQGVCATRCRGCRPYIKRMFRTGETQFNEIITQENEGAD